MRIIQISWMAVLLIMLIHNVSITDSSKGEIDIKVHQIIPLTGNGDQNVLSQIYPGDLNGDGKIDWIQCNGTKLIRAIDHSGELLWKIRNQEGMGIQNPWHPWTEAIWDIDEDGNEDVIHFWNINDHKKVSLVIRNGINGSIKKQIPLWFEPSRNGHAIRGMLSIIYPEESNTPQIIVTGHDYLHHVRAYDFELNELWRLDTPNAGHFIWSIDINGNDKCEYIMIGKYAIDQGGTILWKLEGWEKDHVDTLAAGDINPAQKGYEIVAAGASGTRLHSADDGKLIWRIPPKKYRDPQNVAIAEFDSTQPGLNIVVKQRATEPQRFFAYVDWKGTILNKYNGYKTQLYAPSYNIDLDGNRNQDEILTSGGLVIREQGQIIVDKDWYWNQQELSIKEQKLHDHWKWNPYVIAYDVTGDGRDELIAWGRHILILGENRNPMEQSLPSLIINRTYRIRTQSNRYLGRAGLYFDYRRMN